MVASSAVSVGEQLAYIPRGTLLCAKNSSISQVMVEDEQFMKQLESASSWVPLLTALVYEWSKMVCVCVCVCVYVVMYVHVYPCMCMCVFMWPHSRTLFCVRAHVI